MSVEFLTPPECARLLRCRQSRILSDIRAGKLFAVNLSSGLRPRYRVSRQALEDYLSGLAVVPASKPIRRQRQDGIPRYV